MRIRILSVLLLLLLLLSACGGADPTPETGEPGETTVGSTTGGTSCEPTDIQTTDGETSGDPSDKTTSGETSGGTADVTTGADTVAIVTGSLGGGGTTAGDSAGGEPEPAVITLPKPYIDIEFENGTAYDRMECVDCKVVNPQKGNVVSGEVSFGGKTYETEYYSVMSSGGVLRLEYRDLEKSADLSDALMGGFTMEAFLVNHSETTASSGEQCMISSTQSGGYNFTLLDGKYKVSVYAGKAYRTAVFNTAYDRVELTHLVGVYDAATRSVLLYVNGELVDKGSAPGLLGLASGECYRTIVIGGDIAGSDGTNLHCPSLDVTDFKLYRTAFDGEAAEALYLRAVEDLTGKEPEIRILEGTSEITSGDPLFTSYPESFADVYAPKTALANAPTVLYRGFSDVSALSKGTERPATVLLNVTVQNGILRASSEGKDLGTLYDAVKALDKRIIPAFCVEDERTAEALAGFINENYIGDAFVIAKDAALLKRTAESTFSARPILDLRGKTSVNVEDLTLLLASIGTKNVILDSSVVTSALVTRLRARSINVVAALRDGSDLAELHTAVHSSISGVLTDDYTATLDYYETFTDRTLSITPLVAGHRGDMQNCPENLLRSLVSAANSGAKTIEFDVWLTKDGHLVLNHDNVTTHHDKQLTCKESTRAELEELVFVGANAEEGDGITFLDEVFALFSKEYPDVIFTIEVKDAREVTIDAIASLADEYGVRQQIILIGMNHLVPVYAYEKYGFAVQMNQSAFVKKDDPETSLAYGVIESTRLHSACYSQHAQENAEFIEAISHRLVKYSTWTSSSLSSTRKNYLCGATEYTSNFPHAVDDFYRYLTLTVDADGKAKILATTYKGEEIVVTGSAELVVLSGEGSFSGGMLSGSGTFCFRVRCSVPNVEGSDYYLYTGAVTR